MSHPTDPTPETAESAAQYRVSAQELSHIVHILQARKEAEARHRAGTVALGDAVEQLGLDKTPEQLLEEIQADRTHRSGVSRPKRQTASQRSSLARIAIFAGLAGMMAMSVHQHSLNRAIWENRRNPYFLTPFPMSAPASPMPDQATMTTPAIQEPLPEIQMPAGNSALLRPFSEFSDGERADCEFGSLRQLASGRSAAEVLVRSFGTSDDRLWTVEKHSGEVQVHAFAAIEEKEAALNGYPAHVYASPHQGLEEQLLPLSAFDNAQQVDMPGHSGALLNPAAQAIEEPQNSPFSDSKPSHWAYQAVTEGH